MSFKRLINRVFKVEPSKILVGRDFDGNRYYEIPPQRYYFGLINHNKTKRIMEIPDNSELQQTGHDYRDIYVPKVPREWDAWLRWTRSSPPTFDELEQNIIRADVMKYNIHKKQEEEQMATEFKRRQAEEYQNKIKPKSRVFNEGPEKSETVESWTAGRK